MIEELEVFKFEALLITSPRDFVGTRVLFIFIGVTDGGGIAAIVAPSPNLFVELEGVLTRVWACF